MWNFIESLPDPTEKFPEHHHDYVFLKGRDKYTYSASVGKYDGENVELENGSTEGFRSFIAWAELP